MDNKIRKSLRSALQEDKAPEPTKTSLDNYIAHLERELIATQGAVNRYRKAFEALELEMERIRKAWIGAKETQK